MPTGSGLPTVAERLAIIETQLRYLVHEDTTGDERMSKRIDDELVKAKEVHDRLDKDVEKLWREVRMIKADWDRFKNRILGAILATAATGGLLGSGIGNLVKALAEAN